MNVFEAEDSALQRNEAESEQWTKDAKGLLVVAVEGPPTGTVRRKVASHLS
jgi:hypothetical protein